MNKKKIISSVKRAETCKGNRYAENRKVASYLDSVINSFELISYR